LPNSYRIAISNWYEAFNTSRPINGAFDQSENSAGSKRSRPILSHLSFWLVQPLSRLCIAVCKHEHVIKAALKIDALLAFHRSLGF
jgi:hypothetical protein